MAAETFVRSGNSGKGKIHPRATWRFLKQGGFLALGIAPPKKVPPVDTADVDQRHLDDFVVRVTAEKSALASCPVFVD